MSDQRPRIAMVVWSGALGGAETWTASMAQELRRRGVDATVICIAGQDPLAARLRDMSVPCVDMGLRRGGQVVRAPRRYARLLASKGASGAILMTSGYMATTLRLGGYREPIIGVEHGHVLQGLRRSGPKRWIELQDLRAGARSVTAQVAVSRFMLAELQRLPHHARCTVIPNGVDVGQFRALRPVLSDTERPVVGWAGRMVPGKGVDDLLRAIALLPHWAAITVRLAGDGPERQELEDLAISLGIEDRVEFIGRCNDMPTFWNRCDIAVASSNAFVESFGLAPLEASACGRPVIATRNGGYVDVVEHGITGQIVDPGNFTAVASALLEYLDSPERARSDGARGRTRAETRFSIAACAQAYLCLLRAPGTSLGGPAV